MKRRVVSFALLALGVAVTTAMITRSSQEGLVVHEWGTFTTVAGPDGRAVDWFPLDGPVDLPCFVERYRPPTASGINVIGTPRPTPVVVAAPAAAVPYPNLQNAAVAIQGKVAGAVITQFGYDYIATKNNVRAKVRMETPVLYFYSPTETTLDVRVDFPRGLMTEWYPKAELAQGEVNTLTLADSQMSGRIMWNKVTITPAATPQFLSGSGTSHYFVARATDAAPVAVNGQTEKFLFYRGVANFDVPLTARALDNGGVTVGNLADAPLPIAILFEKRGDKLGYRVVRNVAGTKTISRPSLDASFESLRRDLIDALVGEGLYRKEAVAMVDTWKDSWFEEGSRVFYVFPRKTVDATLPLTLSQKPIETARVFVGRMEVITPATLQAVRTAMLLRNTKAIEPYARFFGNIGDRLSEKSGAAERMYFLQTANRLLDSYVDRSMSCR